MQEDVQLTVVLTQLLIATAVITALVAGYRRLPTHFRKPSLVLLAAIAVLAFPHEFLMLARGLAATLLGGAAMVIIFGWALPWIGTIFLVAYALAWDWFVRRYRPSRTGGGPFRLNI